MSTIIRKSSSFTASILFVCAFVLLALSTSPAGPRPRASVQRTSKITATLQRASAPTSVPSSGTLNPTGPTQAWTGTVVGPNVLDESTCVDGATCDTYTLTLSGTPADWTGKKAHVEISWDFTIGDDFDVVVHKGSNSGPIVGSSFASSTTEPEVVEIDPNSPSVGTGVFTVHVIYFLALPGDTYAGNASATGAAPTPTPNPTASPSPTPLPPGMPRFQTYQAPPGFGGDAGEPSIGSNWLS